MVISDVKFIRKYLYSMGEEYSKFRGRGRVSFDGESIVIEGKRIYQPMMLRAALVLFFARSLDFIFKIRFAFWPFVLISYYLLQFVFLKKESLALTWPQINKYEVDDRKKIISFAIENNSTCSPVVFTTGKFDEIAEIFREKIRERERTSHGWTAVEQRYDEQMNSMAKSVDKWFEGKRH